MFIKNNLIDNYLSWLIPIFLSLTILITGLFDNFLLFHFLAEFFSIFVAICIGIIVYYTFPFTKNRYLLFIGLGYIWIGLLDVAHTLTFPGMNIFEIKDVSITPNNVTLNIWILTRFCESFLILVAPFMRYKNFSIIKLSLLFFIISVSICVFSFLSPMTMFIKDSGLTLLKISFEYMIIIILLLSLFINKHYIKEFSTKVYHGVQLAIILTILAELSFTSYIVWDGFGAILGHVFKFLSFWVIFETVVKVLLKKPIELLEKDASSFDVIPMPSIVVSSNGIILQVNKASCIDLNKDFKDIIGKSNHKLFHPSDCDGLNCKVCQAIQNEEETIGLELYDSLNNKYYQYSLSPIGNKKQNLGMNQTRLDISKRRLSEIEKNSQLEKNERLYRDLFELNKSIILLLNPTNGKIINANNSAVKFYGYEKSKLLTLYISDINTSSLLQIEDDINILNKHKEKFFTFRHKLANNKFRHVRVYSTLSTFNEEKVLYSTIIDVTEEYETKSSLINIRENFRKLFDNAEVSIWEEDFSCIYESFEKLKLEGIKDLEEYMSKNPNFILDMANGIKIINVNKATLKMFGAASIEKFVDSIIKVFGKNSLEVFKKELLSIWNKEETFREESDFVSLDGKVLFAIVSFIIPKTKEEFKSIPVSILDISEIKEKDNLIYQQSKLAAMGEMISNIAHQWRQPLTTISMVSNNLIMDVELDTLNSTEVLNCSNNILKQTEYLSKTIDDFRNFFRVDKEIKLFNISQPIEKTLNLVSAQFKNKNINVIIDLDDIEIKSLENELTQVLIIVLNNARDALLNKDGEKYIFIKAKQEDSNLVVSIKDNAGGIPKEVINRVFEPYFTTKHKNQGTGIGLYMANEIITKHLNGKITIETTRYSYKKTKHIGAILKITLPMI